MKIRKRKLAKRIGQVDEARAGGLSTLAIVNYDEIRAETDRKQYRAPLVINPPVECGAHAQRPLRPL